MKLNISKLLIFIASLGVLCFITPKNTLAQSVPDVWGCLINQDTGAGVDGVWIMWNDDGDAPWKDTNCPANVPECGTHRPHRRYAYTVHLPQGFNGQTCPGGHGTFAFAAWSVAWPTDNDRYAYANQRIDSDKNGSADTVLVRYQNNCAAPNTYNAAGCTSEERDPNWNPADHPFERGYAFQCTTNPNVFQAVLPSGWQGIMSTSTLVLPNNRSTQKVPDLKYDPPDVGPPPTTNPVTPGSLGTLHVKEYSDATTGTYGTTKRRVAEGGTNIYNPVQITQLVTNSNYKLVATAFTNDGAPPPTGTGRTLSELRAATQGTNGFVLLYANQNATADGRSFDAGQYYVNFNGGWYGPNDINETFVEPSNAQIQITPINNTRGRAQEQAPTFQIIFLSPLTGNTARTWGNYSYLMDSNGTQNISVKDPAQ